MTASVIHGDCLEAMAAMEAASVDAIVTDPPYGLSFMGKGWDHGVPGEAFWVEALRVAKPGTHLVAFGGTRTFHRLTCAIEDAGWEIRDCLMWLYGSGFPKSLDVSKAIDKVNGEADRLLRFTRWMRTTGVTQSAATEAMLAAGHIQPGGTMAGHYFAQSHAGQPAIPTRAIWRTLRPLCGDVPEWVDTLVERIEAKREVVGKRDGVNTRKQSIACATAAQGLAKSTRHEFEVTAPATDAARQWSGYGTALKPAWEPIILARKPLVGTVAANVLEHGTGAVNVDGCRVEGGPDVETFSDGAGSRYSGVLNGGKTSEPEPRRTSASSAGRWPANVLFDEAAAAMLDEQSGVMPAIEGDTGGASRFFYCAKVATSERGPTNTHPTVKPTDLMAWLVRLITPPGGTVLDPFAGSGSTGIAALGEGKRVILIEREAEYVEIIKRRLSDTMPLFAGAGL